MSLDLLGEGFDLHLGGLDLVFPHHENERAQAVADGKVFARRWAHNGMVVDERGEKMSKSVGNISFAPGAARALRRPRPAGPGPAGALPLAHERHRRSARPRPGGASSRLDNFARETRGLPGAARTRRCVARFKWRMDDDFDTPWSPGRHLRRRTGRPARPRPGRPALAAAVRECCEGALGLFFAAERGTYREQRWLDLVAQRDAARVQGRLGRGRFHPRPTSGHGLRRRGRA